MALLKLEADLRLDVAEIDSQHEVLIGLVNRLHEAMRQASGKETLDALLAQLLEHTRSHFAYEEDLMSRYDYPHYAAHKSDHDRLLQQLQGLVTRYYSGDLLLSFAVVLELKGWATVHIEKVDKPLGVFLNRAVDD